MLLLRLGEKAAVILLRDPPLCKVAVLKEEGKIVWNDSTPLKNAIPRETNTVVLAFQLELIIVLIGSIGLLFFVSLFYFVCSDL